MRAARLTISDLQVSDLNNRQVRDELKTLYGGSLLMALFKQQTKVSVPNLIICALAAALLPAAVFAAPSRWRGRFEISADVIGNLQYAL